MSATTTAPGTAATGKSAPESSHQSFFGAHPFVRYAGIRFIVSIFLAIGVTLVTFILTNLVPTDPVTAVLGESAAADPAIVANMRRQMGLDKPLPVQYLMYLQRLLHGDMGTSAQTHNPVAQDLSQALPATMELALITLVISVIIGVGLGLYAALHNRRFSDQLIRLLSLLGISVPSFWLAMLCFYFFFYKLGLFPGTGRLDPTFTAPPHVTGIYITDALLAGDPALAANAVSHAVLPSLVMILWTVGFLLRFCRSSVLEVLSQDYVTAARAKGLPSGRITFAYVLRGALLPILTMIGMLFGGLMSGSVLVESVFSWHGLGQYAFQAAKSLDLQAIMGVGLTVGVIYITVNFVVDLLYGLIDPRVRVQ
ncbi:ABC transporter permease [Bifidobacterium simiarum]|uniref:ABC transporter permease n=1 Tax=Bifidobacterium simiarum TaxID=2045441 RepID=UPI001BDC510C|nr:ABC transporter permease [Bifidobacterium simiarum]MBT1166101.1 ABC transporter permease [Bifidobacterium simiarum]